MPSTSKMGTSNWKYVHQENLKNMKTTDIAPEKQFDAVKFMRQQRDKLTEKLSRMSKPEIIAYFQKRNKETTVKPLS
jgi:hypothetical protein